jgi:hypothetical protein
MPRTLVILWLGTAAAHEDKALDLASWAESRHVLLGVAPRASWPGVHEPENVAIEVEGLLRDARAALDSGDPRAAEAALEAAESRLREQPPPQAAWLLAEILRMEAERLRADEPDRAARVLEQSHSLETGRAPSFRDPLSEPPAAAAPLHPLEGTLAGDAIYVDALLHDTAQLPPGEHHVRVVRRGAAVFSGWVTAGNRPARIRTAGPPPCSDLDLAGTRIVGDRPHAPRSVSCPRWAVARDTSDGIAIAICERDACGSLLPWRRGQGEVLSAPAQVVPPTSSFPAWLGWTIAGVATATATGLVLWQTGALDPAAPPATRFVFTPPERPAAP